MNIEAVRTDEPCHTCGKEAQFRLDGDGLAFCRDETLKAVYGAYAGQFGISASRVSIFETLGIEPSLRHFAHDRGVPCGMCDAPLDSKPQRGEFPASEYRQ